MGAALPVGTRVRVRVPASSANLGPGFDSVGLALGVWDSCEAVVTDAPGLVVDIEGQGSDAVPRDESHLIVRTMRRTWSELGVPAPHGLHLRCVNEVPHGRGMGSSATAIVTGIVVAQALSNAAAGAPGFDAAFVNSLAARLEGHPDNASASVFGGATLSVSDDPDVGTTTVALSLHPRVAAVVYVPGEQLSTAKARAVLPDRVTLVDAAANSARVGLLVHALTRDPGLLLPATVDRLHQEPRRASYAASMALVDRLRADGHAAVISGAGPSVLVLSTVEQAPSLAAYSPDAWGTLYPEIPTTGAHLLP